MGLSGLEGFLDLSGIIALLELACARLVVCWVTYCGLVGYDVSSLAKGQCAKLSNGNTRASQTIDYDTSNSNTNISNCPTKIINKVTLTTRIFPMEINNPYNPESK